MSSFFCTQLSFHLAGSTGYIADGHSDIEAILGLYEPATDAQKRFVEHMQRMFYEFVRTGHLPLDARADSKVYVVDDGIGTVDGRPSCDLWENSGLYPQYARRD